MNGARDLAVTRIAAGQRTMVTTEQLAECDVGKDAIAHRVRSGRLHREFQGVYSVGCGELPPLAREQGALLACGERSFLSHMSSAFVWGMRDITPAKVEVTVVGRSCEREGVIVHRARAIDPKELRRHEGLWVSSPARLCLEIAATSPSDLPGVIDAGLANRLLNRRDVEAVLRRHRGHRGAARLSAILGDESAMTITRSQAEKTLLKLIRESGLPMPEVNVRFGPYRPDFMWRSHRLIVELDSYGFHGGPGGFQNDRNKDLFYRSASFDSLRFTCAHVVYRQVMVLATLARTLALREPG